VKRRVPPSPDIERDPFHEQVAKTLRWRTRVLGATVEFSSNSRELLGIAQDAFARVPQHRWSRDASCVVRVRLERVRGGVSRAAPPKPVLTSGAGLLLGHVDAHNFVVIDPAGARALIQVEDSMLRHRGLVRYELIEFATITLATRVQGLVALHAGCVGIRGRGVLLLGSSGAGKSTLALQSALAGLDFLAEDSVFVNPATLYATGLSAYVHAREDALPLIGDPRARRAIGAAPRILRRSGVRKREVDLRRGLAHLAPRPLRIVAAVVLSARRSRGTDNLAPLTSVELRRVLRAEQPYAAARPGWLEFEQRVLRAGAFRLGRVSPADGVAALRHLLARIEAQP
jgi:hypothetical protein